VQLPGPNCLKLLWSKVMVVSVKEKAGQHSYLFDTGFIHFLQSQYVQVLQGLAFFEKLESPINVPGKLDIKTAAAS
jgi:hypothetical protein